MPTTRKLDIEYPAESQPEWYDVFVAMMNDLDSKLWLSIENGYLFLAGGGTVSFEIATSTLTWTEDFEVHSSLSGGKVVIPAGSLAGISDGDVIYVEISRPLTGVQDRVLASSGSIGSNLNRVFIGLRRGDDIVLRNQLGGI